MRLNEKTFFQQISIVFMLIVWHLIDFNWDELFFMLIFILSLVMDTSQIVE